MLWSYGGKGGGGSSGGDGDSGAIIWLIFELLRFLAYLTIEYPAIGIPLDIIVICAVVYYFFGLVRNCILCLKESFLTCKTSMGVASKAPKIFESLSEALLPQGSLLIIQF